MALHQFPFISSHIFRVKNITSVISSSMSSMRCVSLSKCRLRQYSVATESSNQEMYNPIESNLDELLKALNIKYGDIFSIHKTKSIYQTLVDYGIDCTKVKAQLVETPDLLEYPETFWKQTCQVFAEFDFTPLKIFKCITLHPELLRMKPNRLRQNLLELNQIEVGKSTVLKLAKLYPILYSTNPQLVKKSLKKLSTIFGTTELRGILTNCPSVIFSPFEETIEKMTYVCEEMGLSQELAVETKVLSKSMKHICTRHEFLKRAGLYKKPALFRDKTSYKKNAPLTLIMDTTDRYFGNKVSRLSYDEYQAFQLMMDEELDGIAEASDEEDMLDLD